MYAPLIIIIIEVIKIFTLLYILYFSYARYYFSFSHSCLSSHATVKVGHPYGAVTTEIFIPY